MLHLPTIALFTSTLMLATSAVFALMVRLYPGMPGLRHWVVGCLLVAIGYAIRLLGVSGSDEVGFWWAGLCFLGDNLAFWIGILRFCRLRHRLATQWLAPAFLLAWLAAAALPHAQQVATNQILSAITCLFAGLALLRAHELDRWLLRGSVAGVYLLSSAVLLVRALFVGIDPAGLANWQIDALSAAGAPVSTPILMLRCFALLVLLHAAQERLLRGLATTDGLTGLLNRQGFFEQAGRMLERHRAPGACHVLMLDLDHFKQVNDVHGHAAGDEVLRCFAALLREHLRPGDVVGRIGGEEFAVVLVGVSLPRTREIAERLRRAWAEERILFAGRAVRCAVSVGIDSGVGAIEARLAEADQALYRAKANGRNQVVVHVA